MDEPDSITRLPSLKERSQSLSLQLAGGSLGLGRRPPTASASSRWKEMLSMSTFTAPALPW